MSDVELNRWLVASETHRCSIKQCTHDAVVVVFSIRWGKTRHVHGKWVCREHMAMYPHAEFPEGAA